MAVKLLGLPNPCDLPLLGRVCHAIGGAAHAVANDVFGAVAHAFAVAAQHMIGLALSFWTRVKIPHFDNVAGPVGQLRSHTAWIVTAVTLFCALIALGRLALRRNSVPAEDLGRGLLAVILTSALAVPVVNLLASFADSYSAWIMGQATDSGTRLGGFAAGFAALDAPLAFLLGFLAILASLAQVVLMVVRVGIVMILSGLLPIFAGASSTKVGDQSFRRALGWLLAAVLYGPTAAIIYASAIWLVNAGQDVLSVISGLALIILAVLALPALLRLIQPLTQPAVMHGGGGAMSAAGVAVASGARMSSSGGDSSGPASAPMPAPSGASGSSSGSAAGAAAASNGAAAASNGAAGGGAAAAGAAAAHPAAAAVLVGAQAAQAAKGAATSAVNGSNGQSSNGHQESE